MSSVGSSSGRSSSEKRKCKRLRAAPPPNEDTQFEKLEDPIAGDLKLICNFCARLFQFRADEEEFGLLKTHFDNKHCTKIRNEASEAESEPQTYSGEHRKTLAIFICVAPVSLITAECDQLQCFLSKACKPPPPKIPRVEIIHEIAKLVRESLLVLKKDFVKLSNKVSICCDVWSSEFEQQFLKISCHWVDESWNIQKRLIAFRRLYEDRDPPDEIAHEMHKILLNYGLDSKVFSISFDDQTASTYSLEALSNSLQPSISADFFHARCLNNVLTMCVQDALNALEEEITPIRNAAMCIWRADTCLLRKWATFCKKKGLIPRSFSIDFSGCAPWYLSYRMVRGCFEYRDALCSFFAEQQFEGVRVNSAHFEACSSLYQLLTTFYQVVEELSRVYHPTSVLVLDNCVKIAVLFNSLMGRDGLAQCVAKMIAKWLKYFREIPTVFLLAKVFDPRVRLHGVEKLLEIYYDALFPIKDENTPIPSLAVANVKKCLYDLFQEYSMKHGASLGVNLSSGSHIDEISLLERLQNLYYEVSEKRPRCYGANPYGELETYLTARFEYIVEPEFDVLKWWSRMTMQFPVMSLIAKGILAAPALSVSAEQAFGTGGYVLDWQMSNYLCRHPQSPLVEKQLLLGDWKKAMNRNQENDYDDGNMSEEIYDSELDDY